MKSNILAIVNPKAGTLRNKSRLLNDFIAIFAKEKGQFLHVDFKLTQFPGHATELARSAAQEGYGLCLAMGGDGTMNEVALGLLNSETPLGIIPLGSGNGLARHLGVSMDPKKAFRQLLAGYTISMDSGQINGRPFFLAAGIGFEGVVAHEFSKQKVRGFSQYIQSAAKAFWSYNPISIEWEIDKQRMSGEVFTMTFANGSQYGNNARIAYGSSICDGKLNQAIVFPFPFWKGSQIFLQLMQGKLNSCKHYQIHPFERITMKSIEPLIGHLDGEPVNFGSELEVKILPGSLLVRVPENTSRF